MTDSAPIDLEGLIVDNPLFLGIPRERVQAAGPELFRFRSAAEGEAIARQGTPADEMFLILTGVVRVVARLQTGEEAELVRRGPNDFVGEMALIESGHRSADLVCATPCELAVVNRDSFTQLLEQFPEIGVTLSRTISQRLRESTERRADLAAMYRELFEMHRTIITQKRELEGAHERLETYAREQARLNLELTRKNELLYQNAITDALTGIFNRSHVLEVLTRELGKAKRYDSELTCILLDIDRFKNLNDTHGHLAGDFVLVRTAELLTEAIREPDVVGRYGGEEFLVVLPETDLERGVAVAERIRNSIESSRHDYQGTDLGVSVSLGVTDGRRGRPITITDLLKNADTALYRAKDEGRNRVCVYEESD